jgi:hypothetical protein
MTQAATRFNWRHVRDELDLQLARRRTSFADDAERTAAILRERSARLAIVPAPRDPPDSVRFVVFSSGGARFGLPLTALQEIAPLAYVARTPGADAAVRGIMSWRGELVSVFDTLALIGGARAGTVPPGYAAIFRDVTPFVALAFERPEGIGRASTASLRGPLEWQSRAPDLFRGATDEAVALFETAPLVARLRQSLRAA